jgi:hypothetical protein
METEYHKTVELHLHCLLASEALLGGFHQDPGLYETKVQTLQ